MLDKNDKIENGINIINFAIENNISMSEASIKAGFSNTYVKNIKINILSNNESLRTNQEISFLKLHESAISKRLIRKKIQDEKNLNIDEKFDERSRYWVNRDKNNNIESYSYEILVRDEQPFKGELTRSQLETIFAYYPYATQNTVSQFFPFLNYIQLKRILRVFNITKDKLFPQHLTEELSDLELAELALKNKEASAYKKFIEVKNKFYETELRKLQTKVFELDEQSKYIENIVDKVLNNYTKKIKYINLGDKLFRSENEIIHNSIVFTFGDIHFGKYFKDTIYGRGVDKNILKERCMEIAKDIVYQSNLYKTKSIVMNVMGDIFESILPDGMHPEHHKRMDLIGEKQLEFGLEVFEEMIDYIQTNIKYNNNIQLYCIGGNHDRIQEDRSQDKRRTASAIFYIMLKKIFQLKGYENINVFEPEDGIIKYSNDNISYIAFHGDSSLFKANPIDIINLFKVGDSRDYTVILNGHWHSINIIEGVNYKKIICGSVCSADEYIQNELGRGSQPSYVVTRKSKGFGVDVEIKTLK
jgi:hypothetical protein